MSLEYQYKTDPFKHQREEFESHRDDSARAIFWEQGTGKTKLAIDTMAWLYQTGKINSAIILAPKGIHRNWIVEELPKHLPESVAKESFQLTYRTDKTITRWFQDEIRRFWSHDKLRIIAMSYDGLMTAKGRDLLWKLFKSPGECLYIADESARIKAPKAKRTIRAVASSKYAKYRRILSGTPVANSPFDIYSQLKFLDENFWKKYAIGSSFGFRTQFAQYVQVERKDGRVFPKLVSYQNLDKLKQIVDTVSTRVTKDDVLDLPPKLYSKVYFELNDAQRRIYDDLVNEFMTFLDSGEMVTAPLAIVRLLRLQQICSGYLPSDENPDKLVPIGKSNPRLALLGEYTQDLEHQTIIWSRFRHDIDLVCDLLGKEAVRYDGAVDDDGRARAIDAFQGGDAKFFVANQQVAGEGLTLTAARNVIYYTNSFKLTERLQSEDRPHRIGQHFPVNYVDFIALNTIDPHIVSTLASKLDIASMITGDQVKAWL